mmetsp:Transcript_6612/g.10140  ORF Transcript_6612/g.10140 Transcript_6612/m.10140 type:complete len:219 (+) Transcript_6612:367-1023(+)
MHAVLADGGDRVKSERLPVGEDGGAKGTLGRVSWIRGAQHLAAECPPVEHCGVELHHEVVDGGAGDHEGGAHGHEEAIEDVNVLHLAAVEPAAKFDELVILLSFLPLGVQAGGVDAQALAGIQGIKHLAVGQRRRPVEPELRLELVGGDGEVFGLDEGSLGRNGVVVLVDEHVRVDLLPRDLPLGQDPDAARAERLLDERDRAGSIRMRFNEDERRIQ